MVFVEPVTVCRGARVSILSVTVRRHTVVFCRVGLLPAFRCYFPPPSLLLGQSSGGGAWDREAVPSATAAGGWQVPGRIDLKTEGAEAERRCCRRPSATPVVEPAP